MHISPPASVPGLIPPSISASAATSPAVLIAIHRVFNTALIGACLSQISQIVRAGGDKPVETLVRIATTPEGRYIVRRGKRDLTWNQSTLTH